MELLDPKASYLQSLHIDRIDNEDGLALLDAKLGNIIPGNLPPVIVILASFGWNNNNNQRMEPNQQAGSDHHSLQVSITAFAEIEGKGNKTEMTNFKGAS